MAEPNSKRGLIKLVAKSLTLLMPWERLASIDVCHQMSVKTIEKCRKRSRHLYLMLRKVIYRIRITSDETQFHLSLTIGKMKIQYISSKKCRKDSIVLKNASCLSGVMVWMEMSSQGLTKPFFVEPNFKIDAKYYQKRVFKS
ncbi:UNVERIFIED_CONTAM: hypothetical protein NCL1_18851 [Trichonephila clavipes]